MLLLRINSATRFAAAGQPEAKTQLGVYPWSAAGAAGLFVDLSDEREQLPSATARALAGRSCQS